MSEDVANPENAAEGVTVFRCLIGKVDGFQSDNTLMRGVVDGFPG